MANKTCHSRLCIIHADLKYIEYILQKDKTRCLVAVVWLSITPISSVYQPCHRSLYRLNYTEAGEREESQSSVVSSR